MLLAVGFKHKGWGVARSSVLNRMSEVLPAVARFKQKGWGVASSSVF